jgi:hypothetical protein
MTLRHGLAGMEKNGYKAPFSSPHMIVSNTIINNHNGVMENRPDIEIPGVDNLYIIGDWIGPDGMLADTSFASAKAVALKILNEKAGIKIHTA